MQFCNLSLSEVFTLDRTRRVLRYNQRYPEYLEAYQKAREEGTREVYHTRVMIVGQYGVGKTSLKKRLLDEGFTKDYNSTDGIQVDPSACYIDISNSVIWKTKAKGFTLKEDTDNPQDVYDSEVAKKLLHAVKDRTSGKHVRDSSTGATCTIPPDRIPDTIKSKFFSLEDGKNQEEKQLKLSFWDFGGQHVFYTTHQTFLTDRAIYLLVVDLTKDLDEKVDTIRQSRRGPKPDSAAPEKVKDYLDYWLNSIHTHAGKSSPETQSLSPPVIIVGTHKDAVTDQYIDDYFHKIVNSLHDKVYFHHVHKTYIAVDNKSDDDHELNKLKETIVQLAEGQRFWGQEVPIKWLLLEKNLRGLKTKSQDREPVHFLKFEDVKAIGFKERMDEASVVACLQFYHSVGDMIFFNEIDLRNLVILDPQWLIDVFKSIITVPEFHRDSRGRNIFGSIVWEKLDKDGVLQEEFIETVWKKLYADISIHSDVMIELMQRFDLICPFENNQECNQGKRLFFVPCLLPKPEPGDFIRDKPLVGGTLFYKFTFLPKGLFHRLVAKICLKNIWPLYGAVFFDYARFEVGDGCCVLTLLAEDNHLELKIHQTLEERTDRGDNLMGIKIREEIEVILMTTIKNYCPNVDPEISVRCICPNVEEEKRTLVPISEKDINRGHKQCKSHHHSIKLDQYKLWYSTAHTAETKSANTKSGEKTTKQNRGKSAAGSSDPEGSNLEDTDSGENIDDEHIHVHTATAEFFEKWSKDEEIYTNASMPRGRCLIINNYAFEPKMRNRDGTEHDVKRLKQLFERFEYTVVVKNDLTAGKIRETLTEESSRDHADSFVLVILSHGTVDAVYGVDKEKVPYKEIYNFFNGENCKKLAGKPKIIIIQACQGKKKDSGVVTDGEEDENDDNVDVSSIASFKSLDLSDDSTAHTDDEEEDSPGDTSPIMADFFIASATTQDYVSWRVTDSGTWFIRALVKIFRKHAGTKDILRMSTMINKLVATKTTRSGKKQMPTFNNQLTKTFYFFPGHGCKE
ncbi:unnamed protein product [Owenia fusiformis]|uniref:non-specific serine/threonine protein kinase n=1 Tax=Owenia fusiformis TaxID=6347 RepID=A0A8S4P418_OWEFU|nr:unnamed protein product [Owenia fusiformis]